MVRQPKAYPVYDEAYQTHVDAVRGEFEHQYPTLHLVGRNGMHKYNNQDHAMMTAMLTVENVLAGERRFDIWQVNEDAEYREAGLSGAQEALKSQRLVPKRVEEPRARTWWPERKNGARPAVRAIPGEARLRRRPVRRAARIEPRQTKTMCEAR